MNSPIQRSPHGSPALALHRQLVQIWATGPGLQRLAAATIPSSVYASWRRRLCSLQSAACSAC